MHAILGTSKMRSECPRSHDAPAPKEKRPAGGGPLKLDTVTAITGPFAEQRCWPA